jgi:hypothetical protein
MGYNSRARLALWRKQNDGALETEDRSGVERT